MQNPQPVEHLRQLFLRPYFKRVWCIQEVLVSSWSIAKCGNLELDLTDLLACAIYIRHDLSSMLCWNKVYCARIGDATLGEREGSLGSLLLCLNVSMNFEATDPRDKVYALLRISDGSLDPKGARTQAAGGARSQPGTKASQGFLKKMVTLFESVSSRDQRRSSLIPDYRKDLVSGFPRSYRVSFFFFPPPFLTSCKANLSVLKSSCCPFSQASE